MFDKKRLDIFVNVISILYSNMYTRNNWNDTHLGTYLHQGPTVPFNIVKLDSVSNKTY